MKNLFYNQGIDTICLVVDTKYSNEEIEKLKAKHPVLKAINGLSLTKDGKYKKIIFQPSNHIDRTKLLSKGSLFFKCITESLSILKGEVIFMDRIDLSVDSKKELDDYKQLARLIILCTATKKNIKKAFTVKSLFDLKEKTVKLDSDRFVMTFYCREDKPLHEAASRLEIRYKKPPKIRWEIEAKNRIKSTIDLFNGIDDALEEVEKIVIPVLVDLYNKEIKKGIFANFTGFMDKYGDFIYTKKIFDEVYKKNNLIGTANNWLKKFRKIRPNALKFQSKESVKNFSIEVNKHLKQHEKTLPKNTYLGTNGIPMY